MMAVTHVIAAATLAVPLVAIAPEYAPLAAAAAMAGGLFPDLDMYVKHRKHLHFPVYYSVATVAAVAIAALVPGTVTVAAAWFLLGAAVHSVMDVFGGGLELRPWQNRSQRAVYDHARGTWIPPRRWIRYDGSPEDLAFSIVLALPVLWAFGSPIDAAVIGLLAVGAGYTAVRRWLPTVAERIVPRLPEPIRSVVPVRYVPESGGLVAD